jgi:hypothetical protein
MAIDTPTHFQGRYSPYSIHGFYCPMALLTDDPFSYMPLMGKVDKIRDSIDPDPGNGSFLIPIILDLLYLRFIHCGNPVTSPAALYRRYSGYSRTRCIYMAI